MSDVTLTPTVSPVSALPTIGLDVGDRSTELCALDAATGAITERQRVPTTLEGLARRFATRPPARIVLECGTHSPWMSRQLAGYGHEVLVANSRRVALIAQNDSKTDAVDAELLARLGRVDPALLKPITHRGPQAQADLALLRTRDALVRGRTRLVNHVRGTVKSVGARLTACSTESFPRHVALELPAELRPVLEPVLDQITQLTQQIARYDAEVERRCTERYPETAPLRQIAGVGPLTALAFVLTLEDPHRFPRSRAVGSFLGLRPRKRASGDRDPECHITKAGDEFLRRLLVSSAHYILGPFGPDTDLRRWGLALAARGRKAAKKRAVVAVARKLAVLLHHLWLTQEAYVPLRPRRARGPAA